MKLNEYCLLKILIILKYLYFTALLLIIGCKENNSSNYENDSEEVYETEGYSDGTYCAEVDYYYSETGTSSSYTLEVEIEDNELTVIHWPNGGWLDSSHFSPQDISDGETSFTSDAGVDYKVIITGSGGGCNTNSYATTEDDLLREREEQETAIREEEEEETRVRQEEEDQENEERRQREEQEDEEQRTRDSEQNNE